MLRFIIQTFKDHVLSIDSGDCNYAETVAAAFRDVCVSKSG